MLGLCPLDKKGYFDTNVRTFQHGNMFKIVHVLSKVMIRHTKTQVGYR